MPRQARFILELVVVAFALWGFGLTAVFVASKLGLTKTTGIVDPGSNQFAALSPALRQPPPGEQKIPAWATGEEWAVIRDALARDSGLLEHVGEETAISPRLIAAMIVPEQLRLFHSEREVFKSYFAPLRILGNQTQFSWGVAGLKESTAEEIETRATSLGSEVARLLAFATADPAAERFARLTNDQDHYYAYLYTALYLKEIIAEWNTAGFDISKRPEILATLFYIGFANSHPNPNPQAGGAAIDLAGQSYSFGGLAHDFYYSSELPELK